MVRSPVDEHESILTDPMLEKNRVFYYLLIAFFDPIAEF